METWFLADLSALQKFFRTGFRENSIKQWPQLEDVPKTTILKALRHATANCATSYTKGRVSLKLLEDIDPAQVETACPHAKALLDRLRE